MKFILFFILLYLTATGITFPQQINFNIIVEDSLKPISELIFGTNQILDESVNWTARRQGGNRMTGYNWENNASSAGSDWNHSNDNFLTWSSGIQNENEPGIVTTYFHNKSLELNTYSLVTLQMAGYVAKDKNGTVSESEKAPSSRWEKVQFEKNSSFSLQPDLNDSLVFIDEYVNFLVNKFGNASTNSGIKGYSLDNEPALWVSTHPRIHEQKPTCNEIILKSINLSKAVKNIDPYAEIFGPVLYGFKAYMDFQDSPDWNSVRQGKNYNWFLDYYLDEMKKAEDSIGIRLLDVLDIHWYPEARGTNRITQQNASTEADKIARVQAPRTLWDKNYIENSWIGEWGKAHLPLIPKIKASIDKFYPGTKLAFTEFSYGGENDITGAIAIADVLGIFIKNNIYFSTFWQVNSESDYVAAAYKMYRNYDGENSSFGNLLLPSFTNDSVNTSVYGSLSEEENKIHLIVINKNFNEEYEGIFNISSQKKILNGKVYKLDESGYEITKTDDVENLISDNFSYVLSPKTIYHFVLETSPTVAVSENIEFPENYSLKVYPNPFNPSCKIEYNSGKFSSARIDIFSINGELVKSFDNLKESGVVTWDGNTMNNISASNGVYSVILRNNEGIISTTKILLLK